MSEQLNFHDGTSWNASAGAVLRAYALEKRMDAGFPAGALLKTVFDMDA
ncbi:MAG: hypothetical protein JNN20_19790 [Betaproteobacteria bacterium]|nr:hypothetical protein [Betaproteobacteria bacterium]